MKETQQSQNISQYLKGANYPADRDELQRTIKRNGAPTDVVDRISSLPNQRFNTENDVTNAFNQGGAGSSNQGGAGGSNQGNQSGQTQGSQRQGGQAQGSQSDQRDTERQGNVGQGGATGGTQGKTTRR